MSSLVVASLLKMKPLIIANWKCNPTTLQGAKKLFDLVKNGLRGIKNAEVIICPPFTFLSNLKIQDLAFKLGAQNCFYEEKGAFTGEISPPMLKSLGCQYVILGHSERRRYFSESDETINKKLKVAIKAKLKPIFCIGESQEGRKRNKTQTVLKRQIEKGLKGIKEKEIKNIILAYEPVWAVGTGKACLPNEAKIVSLFLRKIITRNYSSAISKKLPILYGGSVNSENAKDYIFKAGMSGLLIGGASLNAKEFVKIVKEVI